MAAANHLVRYREVLFVAYTAQDILSYTSICAVLVWPRERALSALYGHGQGEPMTVDNLLARLEKVKRTRANCWLACCPAHDDTSPSLSIKVTDEGTILVKCWAGCGAVDIVQAAGLSLKDLFPLNTVSHKSIRRSERWMPRDVLEALAGELFIAAACCSQMATGKPLSQEDAKRLLLAANRLNAAWLEVKT